MLEGSRAFCLDDISLVCSTKLPGHVVLTNRLEKMFVSFYDKLEKVMQTLRSLDLLEVTISVFSGYNLLKMSKLRLTDGVPLVTRIETETSSLSTHIVNSLFQRSMLMVASLLEGMSSQFWTVVTLQFSNTSQPFSLLSSDIYCVCGPVGVRLESGRPRAANSHCTHSGPLTG